MKRVVRILGAMSGVLVLAAGIHSVAAHHSASMFDFSKTVTLNGTVSEVRWTNPHVTITVNGSLKEGEAPTAWLLETTSPGNLARVAGWTKGSVNVGDRVQVDMNPLREGDQHGGLMRKVMLVATGQTFVTNIRDQERPGIE